MEVLGTMFGLMVAIGVFALMGILTYVIADEYPILSAILGMTCFGLFGAVMVSMIG